MPPLLGREGANSTRTPSTFFGGMRVSATDSERFVDFHVADNGPGIAPEYHERIFVIFQTLAARDKVEGTGVGLSLVKKIVHAPWTPPRSSRRSIC